jgi:hypothetical protein
MTEHKNVAAALAAAQAQMKRATKDTPNPHFKSKYADLASVMDACMSALSGNGIAVTQPIIHRGDGEMVVETILHHGASDTSLSDGGMPLLVNKRDMQGLGSALTYARRFGLMAMAGVAADDDDGNAAAAAPPPARREAAQPARLTDDQVSALRGKMTTADVADAAILGAYKVADLRDLTPADYASAMRRLDANIATKAAAAKAEAPLVDETINY